MKKRCSLLVRLILLMGPIFSLTVKAADCQPKGYESLLKCAFDRSEEVRISEHKLKAAQQLEGVARQWANPELDAESVYKGSEKSETSASLLFDIRLGGKRGADIDQAKAEGEKAQAEFDLNSGRARLELILKLYRLSHLRNEIEIEEESVSTFSKIVSQYQRKGALAPEQEVSLSVFKMATSDHQLSLTKLKGEQESTLQDVIAITGLAKDQILKNLPGRKTAWLEVSERNDAKSSPHMRFSQAELEIAKSQKDRANADSWPDLKLGPSIKVQKEGAVRENFYGVALSIPIPIFSLNGAGREHAAYKLAEAEAGFTLSQRRIVSLRSQMLKKYRETVAALKSSMNEKAIEERHGRIERHFFKGMVSSPLVIEAHRQLMELEQRRNESERDALEALGSILMVDNQFSGVIL